MFWGLSWGFRSIRQRRVQLPNWQQSEQWGHGSGVNNFQEGLQGVIKQDGIRPGQQASLLTFFTGTVWNRTASTSSWWLHLFYWQSWYPCRDSRYHFGLLQALFMSYLFFIYSLTDFSLFCRFYGKIRKCKLINFVP